MPWHDWEQFACFKTTEDCEFFFFWGGAGVKKDLDGFREWIKNGMTLRPPFTHRCHKIVPRCSPHTWPVGGGNETVIYATTHARSQLSLWKRENVPYESLHTKILSGKLVLNVKVRKDLKTCESVKAEMMDEWKSFFRFVSGKVFL